MNDISTRFLVTGTGRSGTGWAAALFTELGYKCGHEQQFNVGRYGPLVVSDSSWMAIPYLVQIDVPIIRMVRDPYDVVISNYARNFLNDFDTSPWSRYVARFRPDIVQHGHDHIGRLILYAAWWDDPITNYEHFQLGVDTASDTDIVEAVEYATYDEFDVADITQARDKIGKVNANAQGLPVVTREQIDRHPLAQELRFKRMILGYKNDDED